MKGIKTYLMTAIMVMAMAWSMSAQAQVLRDADYKSVGRIAGNGLVRDASQRSIGSFEADGTVKDKAGVTRGRISRLESSMPRAHASGISRPMAPCVTARAECWAPST